MKKMSVIVLFFLTMVIPANSSEFFDHAKEDIVSPFTTPALRVFEIGGALTLSTIFFKHELKGKLQNDISEDRPLKKYSKVGDFLGHGVPNIIYVLILGGDYWLNKDEKSLDRAVLMTKATLYSGAFTDILKYTINERRPNGSTHSFPSGHTTTAFAFSSIITMEHSLPLGIVANTMAAFVGFSRMNDNAHFFHDVLAGATIGTMYGVGMYYVQEKRAEKNVTPSTAFMILPILNGVGANLTYLF